MDPIRRRFRAGIGIAALLGVLIAATTAAGAAPVYIPFPDPEFNFSPAFSPRSLSARKFTPAKVTVSADVRSTTGAQPPALTELTWESDRNTAIDFTAIPACPLLGAQVYPDPKPTCKKAIVGRGHVSFEIAFPEQPRIDVDGRVVVFNVGARRGTARLSAYVYLTAPVSGAIALKVKIRRIQKGRYGTLTTAVIPKIAGGNGSLTHLELAIDRKGVFSARCPDGKLQARANAVFSTGEKFVETTVRSCNARDKAQ